MASRPMMSVVIATRDRLPLLRACVDSVRAQRYPKDRIELVLVDDCSKDGTAEYLRQLAREPRTRVVWQQRPRLFAARNAGLATVRGDLVAITDDDCTVPEDWLSSLSAAMESSGADAVGGGIDAPGEALWVRYLADLGFLDANLLPTGDPSYLVTANACFRRSALERMGLFDEALWRSGSEDVDISFRMRRQGMRLAFAPQCRVSHWYGPDARGMLRRTYRAGAGWRVLLDRHRHWEHWTARSAAALAWVARRRGSARAFLELPDPALRPWYGLLNWLQQLCFLAGYVGVAAAPDAAGMPPAPPDGAGRTRSLLAMLSEGAEALRPVSAPGELAALDVDTLLAAARPPDLEPMPPGAPDAWLPAETAADWMERQRRLERDYLARNVALLGTLAAQATLPEIVARCRADGVDVKRFLAWYGSLPRGEDGTPLGARRPVRLPAGWRAFTELAREGPASG